MNDLCETKDFSYVIYSDTDSVYITLKNLVDLMSITDPDKTIDFMDVACDKIGIGIAEEYERLAVMMNAKENTLLMQKECLSMRAFWVKKKRYAMLVSDSEGVRYDEPKLKIMGLETARSSTPAPCREKLKEAIRLILTSDENTVKKFIKDFKEEFKSLTPEQIACPTGVSNIDKFQTATGFIKGTPIHVRGSLVYNKWVKDNKLQGKYEFIRSGDKIKHIYLRMPNPLHQNTIAFAGTIPEEMGLDDFIDYQAQYEKTFLKPLKTILDCIGWSHEKKRGLL